MEKFGVKILVLAGGGDCAEPGRARWGSDAYGAQQQWILWRCAMSRADGDILSTGVLAELVEKGNHLELGTLIIPAEWNQREIHTSITQRL